jgi:hypothetical protein
VSAAVAAGAVLSTVTGQPLCVPLFAATSVEVSEYVLAPALTTASAVIAAVRCVYDTPPTENEPDERLAEVCAAVRALTFAVTVEMPLAGK